MKSARLTYRRHAYVSDFEQFLGQYMSAHPDTPPAQQRGWYIWWDRKVEPAELAVRRADAVPVKGYQYD